MPKNAEQPTNLLKTKVDVLYKLMENEGLECLELKDENFQISLKRKSKEDKIVNVREVVRSHTSNISENEIEVVADSPKIVGHTIKSPIIGMLYRAATPASPAFVKEGDVVEVGKTLCIVEAMKVMNEIKSDVRAKIIKILVENGKQVTAGEDIFVIEKL